MTIQHQIGVSQSGMITDLPSPSYSSQAHHPTHPRRQTRHLHHSNSFPPPSESFSTLYFTPFLALLDAGLPSLPQILVVKFVGEKKMEVIVQRRDPLTDLPSLVLCQTQDEARQTVTQIIKVIHGLVENMKVVMESEQIHQVPRLVLKISPCRRCGLVDHLKVCFSVRVPQLASADRLCLFQRKMWGDS